MTDDATAAGPAPLFRWALPVAGVALLGVGAAALAGWSPESPAPMQIWMLAVAAAVTTFAAAAAGTPWARAAVMGALLWVGLAAQLALTQPQWFQFVQLKPREPFSLALLGAIGLQAAAAAFFLATSGRKRAAAIVRALGPIRIAAILVALAAVSAGAGRLVSDNAYGELVKQFAIGAGWLTINLGGIAALAACLPEAELSRLAGRVGERMSLPGSLESRRPLDRWTPWAAALLTLVVSGGVSLFVFGGAPHVGDEIAYLFQAKYMAAGAISAPPPPQALQAALAYDFLVVRDGRWFAVTPPGWPAVLAVGVRLGVPWLVNPMLGAASVLLAHQVLTRLADRGVANLAALLLATSPWFLGTSASLMTHSVTVAAALLAMRLLIAAREARPWLAFPAGAAMGLAFLARPVDGLIAGVLAGLWTLTFLRRPRGIWVVIAYGTGCMAVGALIFPYDAALMGDPLLMPLTHYQDMLWGPGSNRMGFGSDIGPPNRWGGVDLYRGHSPFEAMLLAQLSAYSANFELFGTPGLSLALAFAALAWGLKSGLSRVMAAIAALVASVFAFYWYSDTFYTGPRYWFLMLPALVVLSVMGGVALAQRLAGAGVIAAGARIGAVAAMLGLFSLAVFLPWRAATRFHDHRDFHAAYAALARRLDNGAVFVRAAKENDMASALATNSPFLEPGRALFLHDLGPAARAAAIAALPGRPIYYSKGRGADGAVTLTRVAPD